MQRNSISIYIQGIGSVGRNFLSILADEGKLISERTGMDIVLGGASDRTGSVIFSKPVTPADLLKAKLSGNILSLGKEVTSREMTENEGGILVDMSSASRDGSRELQMYLSAMKNGMDIVTANKSPLANHWKQIMDNALAGGRTVLYEATVAGGVPLFSLLGGTCGPSTVNEFRGIVSLTANFVLKQMREGNTFMDAVAEAQKRGIAETNFRDDTDGLDGARKTVILANALFGKNMTLKDIKTSGVSESTDVKGMDRYRLIAEITRSGNEVHAFSGLRNLDDGDYLLSLGEMSLGYEVNTSRNGRLRIHSVSDGPGETAAAVMNDVMLLAKEKFQGKC